MYLNITEATSLSVFQDKNLMGTANKSIIGYFTREQLESLLLGSMEDMERHEGSGWVKEKGLLHGC